MDRRIEVDVLKGLVLAKGDLVARLRCGIPAAWPAQIHDFATTVRSVDGLPAGAALTILIEISHELERFARITIPPETLASLDDLLSVDHSMAVLCERFEACLRDWLTHIRPGRLVSAVQAHRVATYIDEHFAEQITLERLTQVSGWDGRQLAKMFKAVIGVSITSYIEAGRIEEAAKRLRQGDKVECVIASTGWRGRKNFFRAFKRQMALTPAQYQSAWLSAGRMDPNVRSFRVPRECGGNEPTAATDLQRDVERTSVRGLIRGHERRHPPQTCPRALRSTQALRGGHRLSRSSPEPI